MCKKYGYLNDLFLNIHGGETVTATMDKYNWMLYLCTPTSTNSIHDNIMFYNPICAEKNILLPCDMNDTLYSYGRRMFKQFLKGKVCL